jgi:protease-4
LSLDADYLLDRRRLKRRLNFWRVLAVLAFVAAILIAVVPGGGRPGGAYVARLNVSGIITENRKLLDAVDRLAKDDSVKAVILAVDSPGGSVAGGETLRAALIRVAAKKPVVAVMGGTAASAAYMISLPAVRIFARDSTLTGSIGVILETGEVSGLLGHVGVTAEAITSGPLKDQPSFTRPLTPEGRAYLHGLVDDMYDQFVTMVADGRHMDKARVKSLADGRAYTGRQALALGLVDQIGGEIEARDWLKSEKQVSDTLPVRDVRMGSFVERATGSALGGVVTMLVSALNGGRMPGGAWAIWQGGNAE